MKTKGMVRQICKWNDEDIAWIAIETRNLPEIDSEVEVRWKKKPHTCEGLAGRRRSVAWSLDEKCWKIKDARFIQYSDARYCPECGEEL